MSLLTCDDGIENSVTDIGEGVGGQVLGKVLRYEKGCDRLEKIT